MSESILISSIRSFSQAVLSRVDALGADNKALRAEVAEMREQIKAPPSAAKGEPGPAGPPGERGEKGDSGGPGPRGDSGQSGERGEKGIDGRDGRDGKDGKDGIASLDDLRAEVAKAVDVLRGALEAEFQKRIVDLIDALPTLRYRAVFKQGDEYRPGDCVTFGGSVFHCNEPTTGKPEDGKAWTLMVKRGRDGREALR